MCCSLSLENCKVESETARVESTQKLKHCFFKGCSTTVLSVYMWLHFQGFSWRLGIESGQILVIKASTFLWISLQ